MLCCRPTRKYYVWELTTVFKRTFASNTMSQSVRKKRNLPANNETTHVNVNDNSKKNIPNYFIGIRLSCPIFKELVINMQKDISTKFPQFKKCLTSPHKLHLTCFVLELSSAGDVDAATECFLACKSYIHNMLAALAIEHGASFRPPGLLFNKISTFNSKVLFLSPQATSNPKGGNVEQLPQPLQHTLTLDLLTDITAHLTQQFEGALLIPSENKKESRSKVAKTSKDTITSSWKPHCTIAKTSADRRHGRYTSPLFSSLLSSPLLAHITSLLLPSSQPPQ
jgi:hypothetical protein